MALSRKHYEQLAKILGVNNASNELINDISTFCKIDNRSFKPNTFVNISNFIKTKNKILSIYKSEIGKHPFPRSIEAIESLAILRGIQSGYKFAEGFHLVFQR